MFNSLRFSLLIAMLTVAIVAIATTTILVGMNTRAEFGRYNDIVSSYQTARMEEVVLNYVEQPGLSGDSTASRQGAITGDNLSLIYLNPGNLRFFSIAEDNVEASNAPIAAAPDTTTSLSIVSGADGMIQVLDGDRQVGVYYAQPRNELSLIPAQMEFVRSINWSLMGAALLAALAAILLTFFLSRRILHPLAELTTAARQLEAGDQHQHIRSSRGEIGELARAFNAMAATLKRNEQLRRNMVSDIAHELRTPLTNVRGYLEAIQDDVLAPDQETIRLLHDETMLLNRLVQDLQELALAESEEIHFDIQPLQIEGKVEDSIRALQPSAQAQQIQLQMQPAPEKLPLVYADARRLAQIMRNLLNNALAYTAAGGKVEVKLLNRGDVVEIQVHDDGEGIDAAHLPYVFERFYRVDPSRNRATGGAGLGLAIVRQLVEAQGGEIDVQSKRGQGCCFRFTLPTQPAVQRKKNSAPGNEGLLKR